MLRSTVDHHLLPESTFEDKTHQGMEHIWNVVRRVLSGWKGAERPGWRCVAGGPASGHKQASNDWGTKHSEGCQDSKGRRVVKRALDSALGLRAGSFVWQAVYKAARRAPSDQGRRVAGSGSSEKDI